jgi:ligand-binding SRPBCC domain-containing protein
MPVIHLETKIKAPINVCFDLSRSINLHEISTKHTNEKAISGKTSGLIELNETVTWRAKHLGFYQNLTVKITQFNKPYFFVDEMISGAFKSFKHEHHFQTNEDFTIIKDIFEYQSPLGIIGKIADFIFLKKYMKNLIAKRNQVIKTYAESDKWKEIIDTQILPKNKIVMKMKSC